MNTDDGYVSNRDQVIQEIRWRSPKADLNHLVEIEASNLSQRLQDDLKRHGETTVSLRSRCPCGSGKRFKSCCYTGDK